MADPKAFGKKPVKATGIYYDTHETANPHGKVYLWREAGWPC